MFTLPNGSVVTIGPSDLPEGPSISLSTQTTPTTLETAASSATSHISSAATRTGSISSTITAAGKSSPSASASTPVPTPLSSDTETAIQSSSAGTSPLLTEPSTASSGALGTSSGSSDAGNPSGTSSSEPSSASAAGLVSSEACSSISCNPKLAAAIFVPIVIVALLAGICIAFFCMRRKGRARLGRGLAFFSHGADATYVTPDRSSAGGSRTPSMREGASPSPWLAAAGGAAGAAGLAAARGSRRDPDREFGRGFVGEAPSSSSEEHCNAPPPYEPRRSDEHMLGAGTEPADMTRGAGIAAPIAAATRDPFADTQDPFADDAGDGMSLLSGDTAVGRGASRARSVRDNASIVSSLQDMDEAGSVHEATTANISRGPSLSGPSRLNSARGR